MKRREADFFLCCLMETLDYGHQFSELQQLMKDGPEEDYCGNWKYRYLLHEAYSLDSREEVWDERAFDVTIFLFDVEVVGRPSSREKILVWHSDGSSGGDSCLRRLPKKTDLTAFAEEYGEAVKALEEAQKKCNKMRFAGKQQVTA